MRFIAILILGMILGCGAEPEPREQTQAGWDALIASLEEARNGLDSTLAFPPPPTDRNMAEGYRYLLGHLARVIESETLQDPEFPYFQRSVSMLAKWTIDNVDTLYLQARIAPEGQYRIRGVAADTTEWRTGEKGKSWPQSASAGDFSDDHGVDWADRRFA